MATMKVPKLPMKKAKTVAPTNMSIQPGSDRPSMKQDAHPDHNMPAPQHDGDELPARDYSGEGYRQTRDKLIPKDNITNDGE